MCPRLQLKPIVTTQSSMFFRRLKVIFLCIYIFWDLIYIFGQFFLDLILWGQYFWRNLKSSLLAFLPVHHVSGVWHEAAQCGESLLSLNVVNLSS